jgi:hypothetical protein
MYQAKPCVAALQSADMAEPREHAACLGHEPKKLTVAACCIAALSLLSLHSRSSSARLSFHAANEQPVDRRPRHPAGIGLVDLRVRRCGPADRHMGPASALLRPSRLAPNRRTAPITPDPRDAARLGVAAASHGHVLLDLVWFSFPSRQSEEAPLPLKQNLAGRRKWAARKQVSRGRWRPSAAWCVCVPLLCRTAVAEQTHKHHMASISSAPHHPIDHGPLLPGLPGFCFVIDVTLLAHSHLLLLALVCRLRQAFGRTA